MLTATPLVRQWWPATAHRVLLAVTNAASRRRDVPRTFLASSAARARRCESPTTKNAAAAAAAAAVSTTSAAAASTAAAAAAATVAAATPTVTVPVGGAAAAAATTSPHTTTTTTTTTTVAAPADALGAPADATGSAACASSSAGIVVIGDEVLRGDVRDANAYFLVRNLRRYGVVVRRIAFVGDEPAEIGTVVKEFASKFNFVLTCGGVGPTHDDITYEAIADAFGQPVALRQDLWDMFKHYFGKDLGDDSPLTKFARIPERAESVVAQVVHSARTFNVCFVKLDNVIILPGVPLATEKLFPEIVKQLGLEEMPEISRELFLELDEASITECLNETVLKFREVKFGSYPQLYGNYYKTRLRMESGRMELLDEAEAFLRSKLPPGCIIDSAVQKPLEGAHKRVERLASECAFVREAYDIVWETLRRYKPDEICVGYSGGKDCTVVAYLYYAALQEYARETGTTSPVQNWLYIRSENARPEVDKFVEESVQLYGASVMTVTPPYKDASRRAIDSGLRIFLLGNRAIDPKGETLAHFKETDPDWPRAMRVFPILKWEYSQVWRFIRELYIPYCPLYDQGFSSLGEKSTPNPKLTYVDDRGVVRFRPAYVLDDGSTERFGRT